MEKSLVESIEIFTVDRGSNQNTRYSKAMTHGIKHFNNYNVDALQIAANASGRSALNYVERRMALLSWK